jgi:twitching motility protein PilT
VARAAARAAQAEGGLPPVVPSALPVARASMPVGSRVGMNNEVREGDLDLNTALRRMLQLGGSDLHLTVGAPPMARVDGGLTPLEGFDTQKPDAIQRVLYSVLSQRQREQFEEELELDFAYALVGEARFRVNLYQQRDSLGAAFRVIPYEILPLESLGIPPVVANFAGLPRGLVLVTGPTGSGKSTTLASIIDLANRSRNDHIMTVEDPIEFLHRHKRSLVNQREVGADTHSFQAALKHVLRQDPDIILVGELRDLETISVALTAAETGHLVFATLHTQDAAQTIDRIIDVFPAFQQGQVRAQLANALQGVVCQTLCRRSDGPGRAVATEVMIATAAVRNLIREGKTHQIYSAMQAGAKLGMHTMDQHLADLVRIGRVSYETGLEKCHHVEEFNRLTGRGSGVAQGATTAGNAI